MNRSSNSPNKNPILFVHGFGDSSATPWWSVLEWRLGKEGYEKGQIHRINLAGTSLPGFSIGSPKAYARKIARKVDEIRAEHDGKKVDIIAHSMGGLDARWYIEKLGGRDSVDKLITLGSPHSGTYIAYLGYFTPGGRDMVPGSSFLQELNEGPLPEEVEYTAVWSRSDLLIVPRENAKLEGANNVNPGFCFHLMLVWSDRSFRRAILPALEGGGK